MTELHPLSGLNVDHAGMEILDPDECHRLLEATPVARLGFVDRGEPVIFPIRYVTVGGSIAFLTDSGSKLEAAVMSRPVAVEIDGWDADAHTGWSVLVKGTAESVGDEASLARLDELGVRPWVRPEGPKQWVRVLPNEITGRRIPSD